MRRDPSTPAGTVHRLWIESEVLKSNMLGDPTRRMIDVYVPHGHDGRGLPLLVDLVGFTAGGPAHTNWKNFGENLPERLDRLIAAGEMPPVVVALPDCFTKLGGNQYINSVAMGRWDDFLLQEAVPLVEKKFGCGGTGKRGVFGKSSGGYGAMVHALLHPDFWARRRRIPATWGMSFAICRSFRGVLRALKTAQLRHQDVARRFLRAEEDEGQRRPHSDDAGDVRDLRSRSERVLWACACRSTCTPASSSRSAGRTS